MNDLSSGESGEASAQRVREGSVDLESHTEPPLYEATANSEQALFLNGSQQATAAKKKGFLFAGGTGLEFSIARDSIISLFKIEKCYDLVCLPEDPLAPIEESKFHLPPEPTNSDLERQLTEMETDFDLETAQRIISLRH